MKGKRLLLIEDNPDTTAFVRTVARLEGADLVAVATGEDGIVQIHDGGPFDLVVLDVNLPGVLGWGVLEDIRKTCTPESAPRVLMFTALVDAETEKKAASLGAVGVVNKPIGAKDLVEKLNAFLY